MKMISYISLNIKLRWKENIFLFENEFNSQFCWVFLKISLGKKTPLNIISGGITTFFSLSELSRNPLNGDGVFQEQFLGKSVTFLMHCVLYVLALYSKSNVYSAYVSYSCLVSSLGFICWLFLSHHWKYEGRIA